MTAMVDGCFSKQNFRKFFKMSSLSRGVFLARSATRLRAAGRPLVRGEVENAPGQVNMIFRFLFYEKHRCNLTTFIDS